jgi:hypothetical protein
MVLVGNNRPLHWCLPITPVQVQKTSVSTRTSQKNNPTRVKVQKERNIFQEPTSQKPYFSKDPTSQKYLLLKRSYFSKEPNSHKRAYFSKESNVSKEPTSQKSQLFKRAYFSKESTSHKRSYFLKEPTSQKESDKSQLLARLKIASTWMSSYWPSSARLRASFPSLNRHRFGFGFGFELG